MLLLGIKSSNKLERNFEVPPKFETKRWNVVCDDVEQTEKIQRIQIRVEKGKIEVTEVQEGTPALVLTEREAATVLFSPASAFYARSHRSKFNNWFPVEFAISNLDEF